MYAFRLVVARTRRNQAPVPVIVALSRSFDGLVYGASYNRVREEHKKGIQIGLKNRCAYGSDPTLCVFDTAGEVEWCYSACGGSGIGP